MNEEWEWEGMERGREGNTRGVGDEGKDSRWFVASWRAQGGEWHRTDHRRRTFVQRNKGLAWTTLDMQ